MIYLAGAIDAADRMQARLWREDAAAKLADAGIPTFNPATAFHFPERGKAASFPEAGNPTQQINNAAILASRVILVELSLETRHVGTLIEMGIAIGHGKPVHVWVGEQYFKHISLVQPGVTLHRSLKAAVDGAITDWHSLPDEDESEYEPITFQHKMPYIDPDALEFMDEDPSPLRRILDDLPETFQFMWDPDACGLNGYTPGQYGDPDFPSLEKDFPFPTRAYAGDAGFDLPVARETTIPAHSFVDVPLAFRAAPPEGYWFRLIGRSSTLRKHGLLVNEGIIDQGWRGPLFAGVWNMTDETVVLQRGMRVAQVIPQIVCADYLQVERVSDLRPGVRGEAGFGSTGT